MPSIRCPFFPSDFLWVMPKNLHLVGYIFIMPKAVSKKFSGTCIWIDEFQKNSGFSYCSERSRHPIWLWAFLPAHDVESTVVLVRKNETNVVVVSVVVDEERALEIYAAEYIRTCCRWRCKVKEINRLQNFKFLL